MEEILSEPLTYCVDRGTVICISFQNADPDLNFNGLDDLLDIHFLLSGQSLADDRTERPSDMPVGVKDFLTLLPARLRRLHTTTQRETRIFNGEIRGRIDWRGTIQERYRTGNIDDPVYACQLAEETVITPENLVLWELLNCIRRAYREANELIPEADGPVWFQDWQGDSRLKQNLDLARSNVHLSELDAERDRSVTVTGRTIRNVLDSRSRLYSEAVVLLQHYRRLHDHEIDEKEAKKLLSHRLFYPAPSETWGKYDTPTFFELYWIFNLLNAYSAAERNLVTQGTRCIATWSESGSEYQVYHDWTGDDRFAFGEPYADRERDRALPGEDGYLGRTADLLAIQEGESRQVFGHDAPSEKTKRPDFVFLRKREGLCEISQLGRSNTLETQ